MEGSGYGILLGSVGSECRPLRVQAGWDVLFDVLERQFLKALHKNRSECHRGLVVALASSLFFLMFDPFYQLEISRQENQGNV